MRLDPFPGSFTGMFFALIVDRCLLFVNRVWFFLMGTGLIFLMWMLVHGQAEERSGNGSGKS